MNQLTKRQRQVLLLKANGLSHKEIAKRLRIRVDTVGGILSRTYTNLGVNNGYQGIAVSLALGIVPLYKIEIPAELQEEDAA